MSNSMSCCISINNHQLFLSLAGAVQNVLNMFCFDRGVNVVESRGLSFSLMCMYVYYISRVHTSADARQNASFALT